MLKKFTKPTYLNNSKWRGLFLFVLVGIALFSAVAVVRVQHEVRQLETHYHQLLQQALKAHEERGRLLLEMRHLTVPGRVEQVAKTELDMTNNITNSRTIYIKAISEGLGE